MANETNLTVDLPSGGTLKLDTADEVELWQTSMERYIDDYAISKQNDKVLLGALLSQQLVMYRAQSKLTSPKIETRSHGQREITKAAEEIRELEKALGIDKKTREAGGQHTVASYVQGMKLAAHEMGVRISERVKDYEKFAMDLRWMIRLLRNGDAEDRQYHNISEKAIVEFMEKRLDELEEKDKKWSREKGAIVLARTR